MSGEIKPPRQFVWIFIAAFVVAEAVLIGIDLYYLVARDETLASFFVDIAITSALILCLVLAAYFIIRRFLVGLMASERRFRELADLLPQAVIETDEFGNVTYANRLALEWFGYEEAVVEGGSLNALQLVAEDEREKVLANYGRLRDGALAGSRNYTALRKDGTIFQVLIASSPIVRDGAVVGLRGVITDITAQKQAEESALASERKYRELADSLPQIVFEMDTEGKITYANANAYTVFGYDERALERGVNVTEFMADPNGAMSDIHLMVELKVEEVLREYVARRPDGSTFPVVISARLVMEGGKPVGIRGILTDITEQKEREEEVRRANAELMGYAHTVSHDLKIPITDVTLAAWTLDQLMDQPRTAEVKGFIKDSLEAMRSGLVRANSLIEDLLKLAESGQVPEDVTMVSIADKVDEILEERAHELEIRGVTVDRDPDLGSMMASPTHIYQVFANLIKNAITYNDSPEPVIEIKSLDAERADEHVFLVKDNGPGIPEDILDDIFVPFRKGASGESGIGLSIVDNIAHVYGGSVRAFNDGGACFEILLRDYAN